MREVVGSDELITPEHIARMPYLHDCIRETQRFDLCLFQKMYYKTLMVIIA